MVAFLVEFDTMNLGICWDTKDSLNCSSTIK